MFALAILLAVAAPASTTTAGVYRISAPEMAGGIELRADGRFRYAFDYGAVSETAEGRWVESKAGVLITSDPMPTPPSFELTSDTAAPKGELWMTVDSPDLEWGHPLEAVAMTAAGERPGFEISADESGRVDLAGRPAISAIAPLMPVYGPTGQIFKLSADRGHRLRFRFHPNELDKAAFDHQLLRRDKDGFVLDRFDTTIRFLRSPP